MWSHVGWIGAGRMAQALARGLVAQGVVAGDALLAADPSPVAREAFQREAPGTRWVSDNAEVVRRCDLVFLAVKPQVLRQAVAGLADAVHSRTLIVSVVAGASLGLLRELTGARRLIRVMPNTPCLIGQGASAYCCDEEVAAAEAEAVGELLGKVGLAERVEEWQLDAVTGLSGSGPAYVFQIIEALADGGVLMGLPRQQALRLAAQTVSGAAAMVLASDAHPAELKDRVASPAGTTIAGLRVLERQGVRGALMDAVAAAAGRAAELAGPASAESK